MPIDDMDERGVGDVLQSFCFSPEQPTRSGLIWGVGPALGIPTASDDVYFFILRTPWRPSGFVASGGLVLFTLDGIAERALPRLACAQSRWVRRACARANARSPSA